MFWGSDSVLTLVGQVAYPSPQARLVWPFPGIRSERHISQMFMGASEGDDVRLGFGNAYKCIHYSVPLFL